MIWPNTNTDCFIDIVFRPMGFAGWGSPGVCLLCYSMSEIHYTSPIALLTIEE